MCIQYSLKIKLTNSSFKVNNDKVFTIFKYMYKQRYKNTKIKTTLSYENKKSHAYLYIKSTRVYEYEEGFST